MSSSGKIPTAAEFAWASRMMAARSRGLDEVRQSVLDRFCGRCPLHDVFVFYEEGVRFRAFVFFEKTTDIAACRERGICDELAEFVPAELERVGRGRREGIEVVFEFDSDENVAARYEGNYFLRLR